MTTNEVPINLDPANAGVELRRLALACLANLLPTSADGDPSPEVQFLRNAALPVAQLRYCARDWQQMADEDRALIQLAQHYQLNAYELLALALALAVEEDAMVGHAIAYLQGRQGALRPTLGLLDQALAVLHDGEQRAWIAGSICNGAAIAQQLLLVHEPELPLPEQSLAVPRAVLMASHGLRAGAPGVAELPPKNPMFELPELLANARQHAHSLAEAGEGLLIIRSAYLEERQQSAHLVCEQLQKNALYIPQRESLPAGIGVYCQMLNKLPVFNLEQSPAARYDFAPLSGYHGPVIILTGLEGRIEPGPYSQLEWTLATPPASERQLAWQQVLGQPGEAQAAARQAIHSPGRISELAKAAQREAQKHNEPVTREVLARVGHGTGPSELDSLAQLVSQPVTDEGLVLEAKIQRQLHALYLRCRHREHLDSSLGISIQQAYHCGVKALMVGPSGTGKTLSASWLATRLGLPLYKVDIASVVSKYIGETEKNLAELMAKAEQADVILLFDEADSLFGKRTEVKDSSDRFANSQSNYLLQRLENYKGIVVLTSNSRGRIDQAFTRRIDHLIEFAQPGPEERRRLWRSHLGEAHQLNAADINKLAAKSDLGAGHIRNAVLAAATLAEEAGREVQLADVLAGLEVEYRKLAKPFPAGLRS